MYRLFYRFDKKSKATNLRILFSANYTVGTGRISISAPQCAVNRGVDIGKIVFAKESLVGHRNDLVI